MTDRSSSDAASSRAAPQEPEDVETSEETSNETSKWTLLRTTLRAQRKNLTIGTLIGLVWMLGKISVPVLVRFGIDRGIEDGENLWMWVLLIALAGIVAGTFTALRRFYAFREARWTETRLRERLFGHIMSLHIGYHDRAQTGQLMSRSSSDLNQIQMFVVMIPITLSNLGMILGVTVILFVSDPLLAVVALAPLPLVNVAGRRFSQAIHPAVLAVQAEQAELATVVEESIGGVRVVKGFGAEHVQEERLEVEADDIRDVSMQAAKVRARFVPAIDLLPQLGMIAVLGIGGLRVMDGDLTLGQLVQFNFFVALLVAPLRMLGMTIAWGQRAAAALERVNEVLDTTTMVADPPDPSHLPATGELGAIRFDDVRFAYDGEDTILDGFDLELTAGQSVALVGGTGSGKSTVARLLVRFYDVQAGSVEIDGIDVRDLTLHDVRRAVGVVFEDTLLFHDTVAANIAFACPDADRETIEEAARLASAHDFIMGLPEAYDTMLGERGYSLSGGQRQRIAIARAVIADPRVLVLDDATSAVDPSKEHEIRGALSTVMAGRTTIVIAHRPGTIALADTVVLIGDGRVVASGTHDDLLANEPSYREVLAAMPADDEAERAAAEAGHSSDVGAPSGGGGA
jgi:ATP-binding cassette subfamily B protein